MFKTRYGIVSLHAICGSPRLPVGGGVYSLEAAVLLLLHYSQSRRVPEKERLSREVSGTCCLMKQERPRRVLFNEHW